MISSYGEKGLLRIFKTSKLLIIRNYRISDYIYAIANDTIMPLLILHYPLAYAAFVFVIVLASFLTLFYKIVASICKHMQADNAK